MKSIIILQNKDFMVKCLSISCDGQASSSYISDIRTFISYLILNLKDKSIEPWNKMLRFIFFLLLKSQYSFTFSY